MSDLSLFLRMSSGSCTVCLSIATGVYEFPLYSSRLGPAKTGYGRVRNPGGSKATHSRPQRSCKKSTGVSAGAESSSCDERARHHQRKRDLCTYIR